MLLHVLGSLGASSGAVMAYALLLVLRPRPWWDAPYAIAVLAYLLGNALSCVAAGLSSVVQELTLGAAPIPIHATVIINMLFLPIKARLWAQCCQLRAMRYRQGVP